MNISLNAKKIITTSVSLNVCLHEEALNVVQYLSEHVDSISFPKGDTQAANDAKFFIEQLVCSILDARDLGESEVDLSR